MNELEITSDWIDRYNENDLDEQERAFFIKQMEVNPLLRTEVSIDACLNRLYQDEDAMDLMKKIQAVSRKPDHGNGIHGSLLIAASLLCLVIFGAIVCLTQIDTVYLTGNLQLRRIEAQQSPGSRAFPPENVKKPVRVNKITPVERREIIHRQHLALNYKPRADFELLVGSVTRSSHLEVIAPAARLKIPEGSHIMFEWVFHGTMLPVNIVFYNSQGNLVFESPAILTGSYLMSTRDWPGGIYYWKIIIDEELNFMGKITLF